tara:strand:+ start:1913 stop:2761 length:849 start_codon:yes stop_codon:yes gene_type:complete
MKLLRWGEPGEEAPGIIDEEGNIRDLSHHIHDIDSYFFESGSLEIVKELEKTELPLLTHNPRIGPCVGDIGKFMCIGLNYSDHAAETGAKIPEHPILFMKATSAVVGPNDMVMLPKNSKKTDWEIELGLVIGEPCKYVNKEDALNYVAGYFIANDVSERNFQKNLTGQWTKGKSCDTFGPIGPWLVTSDEVKDPQDLNMSLDLNGERMQTGNTSKMIFSVAEIISHLSQLFTLHPGDVIITGTPPGVGAGIKPEPKFLKSGDIMSLKIDGLGSQEQKVGQDR